MMTVTVKSLKLQSFIPAPASRLKYRSNKKRVSIRKRENGPAWEQEILCSGYSFGDQSNTIESKKSKEEQETGDQKVAITGQLSAYKNIGSSEQLPTSELANAIEI